MGDRNLLRELGFDLDSGLLVPPAALTADPPTSSVSSDLQAIPPDVTQGAEEPDGPLMSDQL